jgi:uncharacterized membrane protein YdbT with pleckstrin-like domain
MAKKKLLLKVRCSRKKFIPYYLMVLILSFLLINLVIIKKNPISKFAWITSIIFIVMGIKLPEYHRLKDWWGATETSLIQNLGIFDKNVREIDFSSISDLDLEQPLFKRILNYGNVNVRLFLNETSISIKNINNPGQFIERLQEIISKHRKYKHEIGNI